MIESRYARRQSHGRSGRAVTGERANAQVAVARSVGDACNVIVPAAAPAEPESAANWPAASRQPIEPDLPPDHPLEPGSAAGRSRQPLSAAERIAASEAVAGSKPPVIPDPGAGKPDFIAAARRAARAAAATGANEGAKKAGAEGPAQPKTLTERLRTLVVAGAVVVIVLGCFHIASRLFQDGGSGAPARPQAEPPQVQTEPPSAHTLSPPQVEKPSVPAVPVPKANPTSLPTLPLPLPPPGTDAARKPGAPPLANPAPTTGGGAGQQSLLDNPAAPFAMAASIPAAADAGPANGSAAGWTTAPASDITGTLPTQSPQHSSTTPSPAIGDKLPVAHRRTGTARSGARGRRLCRVRGCRPLRRWPAGSGKQRGSRALV